MPWWGHAKLDLNFFFNSPFAFAVVKQPAVNAYKISFLVDARYCYHMQFFFLSHFLLSDSFTSHLDQSESVYSNSDQPESA
jgi:hypothetical protein